MGGIGLFALKDFLMALQCTWVKKAFNCCNDNWKFDLVCSTGSDLNQVGKIGKGLEQFLMAWQIVFKFLRKTLQKQKTIICTLHY